MKKNVNILTAVKLSKKSLLKEISFNVENTPLKFVVEQEKKTDAETHNNIADLFFLISGNMIFTCNGKLVNPKKSPNDQNTLVADKIKNGKKFILKAGEWLFVPANCPHQRITLKKSRFIVVKIPING